MTVTPKRGKVDVTVIADLICPWCYIGYKELTNAVKETKEEFPDFEADIHYRPFILDATLKVDKPVDKVEHLEKKYGTVNAKKAFVMITEKGKSCGIDFKFAGPVRQLIHAHRLLHHVYTTGGSEQQLKLIEGLFTAFFENEKDLGDLEILAQIADETGVLTKADATAFLYSDDSLKDVCSDIEYARKQGVTGVPFTVIDNKWAVAGAMEKGKYREVFSQIAKGSTPGQSP